MKQVMARRDAISSIYVKKQIHSARKASRMSEKSEEIINFANKVCRMCFWDYLPSKVCDASIVKLVSQDVDQIVDQIEK